VQASTRDINKQCARSFPSIEKEYGRVVMLQFAEKPLEDAAPSRRNASVTVSGIALRLV
jgi:hypothetical protein